MEFLLWNPPGLTGFRRYGMLAREKNRKNQEEFL